MSQRHIQSSRFPDNRNNFIRLDKIHDTKRVLTDFKGKNINFNMICS